MSIYNLNGGGFPEAVEPEDRSGLHIVGQPQPRDIDRDDDGQPLNWLFNSKRRHGRNYDELIGMIRGITADGKVCRSEANLLVNWCLHYGVDASEWPAGPIVKRLNRIYEDGIVTEDELDDLKALLVQILGGDEQNVSGATALPLCRPAPEVIFDQNVFVFTGKFASGTRDHCQRETALRGGICVDSVSLKINYLVIGSMGSRDWIHTPWGRKIERAKELQASKPISIISEETWSRFLL